MKHLKLSFDFICMRKRQVYLLAHISFLCEVRIIPNFAETFDNYEETIVIFHVTKF